MSHRPRVKESKNSFTVCASVMYRGKHPGENPASDRSGSRPGRQRMAEYVASQMAIGRSRMLYLLSCSCTQRARPLPS